MLDMTLAIIDIIIETFAVIIGGVFLVCMLVLVALFFAIQDILKEIQSKILQSYYKLRYKL